MAVAPAVAAWQGWAVRGLMAAGWGAVLWFVLGHSYCLYDDAYIYFRFVENLFSGCPLAYNCVDGPVEGFTSPLFFLLLAAGRVFTHDLESVSQLLGMASLGLAVSVAVATAASSRFDGMGASPHLCVLRAAVVMILLVVDHYFLLHAVIGMETGLAALWGALLLWSATGSGRPWLRTLATMGIFVRPEFALFVPMLPLFVPEARKPAYWLPICIVGGLTVATRLLLFGDYLPNTFWAKSGGTADHARLGLLYIRDALLDYPAAALAPLALLVPRGRGVVGYFLATALIWVVFFLRSGGDFFEYSRMLVPLVAPLSVLAAVGLMAVGRKIAFGGRNGMRVGPVVAALLLLLPAGRAVWDHAIPEQHGMARVERWTQVGKYLAKVHPGATVAATPVGAIGYFSGARVLDLVGLVDRKVAKEGERIPHLSSKGKIGHERVNTEYVLGQRPDIIVIDSWKEKAWGRGDRIFTQFYGEWQLIEAIESGRAPYRPYIPQVGPNLHWFMFIREEGK